MSEHGDHEEPPVGYRNPPRHSRFQPGRSGNPRGRPRTRRDGASLLGEVLGEKVRVTMGGRSRKVTVEVAILLRMREQALKGDLRAARELLAMRRASLAETDGGAAVPALASEDLAILREAGIVIGGEGEP